MNNLKMISILDMITEEDFDSKFFSPKEKGAMIDAWKMCNNDSKKEYNTSNPSYQFIKESCMLKLESCLNAFQNSNKSADIENCKEDYDEAVRDIYLSFRSELTPIYWF